MQLKQKPKPGERIPRDAVTTMAMTAGNEKLFSTVIVDGFVKKWIGIGWIDEGPAEILDSTFYPVVEDTS